MPVLLDTSAWIDHLRSGDSLVAELLGAGEVFTHEFVIGELALGNLGKRTEILGLLAALPRAPMASLEEVLQFISRHRLSGRGIGYVDAHLLASTFLLPGLRLPTRDRRLRESAAALRVEAPRD
ncbi:MAG: type II toxin-antitoxin system VapC family toxin [Gammaproteobacteria bacterium]